MSGRRLLRVSLMLSCFSWRGTSLGSNNDHLNIICHFKPSAAFYQKPLFIFAYLISMIFKTTYQVARTSILLGKKLRCSIITVEETSSIHRKPLPYTTTWFHPGARATITEFLGLQLTNPNYQHEASYCFSRVSMRQRRGSVGCGIPLVDLVKLCSLYFSNYLIG